MLLWDKLPVNVVFDSINTSALLGVDYVNLGEPLEQLDVEHQNGKSPHDCLEKVEKQKPNAGVVQIVHESNPVGDFSSILEYFAVFYLTSFVVEFLEQF